MVTSAPAQGARGHVRRWLVAGAGAALVVAALMIGTVRAPAASAQGYFPGSLYGLGGYGGYGGLGGYGLGYGLGGYGGANLDPGLNYFNPFYPGGYYGQYYNNYYGYGNYGYGGYGSPYGGYGYGYSSPVLYGSSLIGAPYPSYGYSSYYGSPSYSSAYYGGTQGYGYPFGVSSAYGATTYTTAATTAAPTGMVYCITPIGSGVWEPAGIPTNGLKCY